MGKSFALGERPKYLSGKEVVPSLLTLSLLLGSSPLQTIQLTGTLLRITGLAATNLAYEGRE